MLGYNLWWQDTNEGEENTWESLLIPGIYTANFVILILQIIGILGNPYVTIVYILEQVDIFLLGSTSRASDIRIVMSCLINVGFVAICMYIVGDNSDLTFVYGILAYVASRNILFNIGIRKPFNVINEELLKRKEHADIVFSGLTGQIPVKFEGNSNKYIPVIKCVVEMILILATIFGI